MNINTNNEITIISGEGEVGAIEIYQGKKTERAIKMRLTRERCYGDRWAKALIFSHSNEFGKVGIDFETGEMTAWHNPE